jgi:hypothetical protein
MKPEDMLRQALEIEAPWHISRMRNDLGKQQIDLWIAQEAPRSAWFFGTRSSPPQGNERTWRHVNIGKARCIVHAVPPSAPNQQPLPWFGETDQPFTHALARQIAGMFMEGVSFQAICSLLDIPVAELWKFKHNLDNGKAGLSSPQAVRTAPSTEPSNSAVPDPVDPVWEKLLDGSINLDIHALSLKLLLTKFREQFLLITDADVRMLKTHEMQRYFVRHEKLLGHELTQLVQLAGL